MFISTCLFYQGLTEPTGKIIVSIFWWCLTTCLPYKQVFSHGTEILSVAVKRLECLVQWGYISLFLSTFSNCNSFFAWRLESMKSVCRSDLTLFISFPLMNATDADVVIYWQQNALIAANYLPLIVCSLLPCSTTFLWYFPHPYAFFKKWRLHHINFNYSIITTNILLAESLSPPQYFCTMLYKYY